MRRLGLGKLVFAAMSLGLGLGAAPAPPSYLGVERAVDEIRKSWAQPGAPAQPNAAGWNAFFDAMLGDLRRCSEATSENDRLVALNRLYKMWVALEVTPWRSGRMLRDELHTWLRPRVRLAWAERRLLDTVRGLAAPASPAAQQNREHWVRFVDSDLGRALRQYDAATTVAVRQEALERVYAALNALKQKNAAYPWVPALTLQTALDDLYNQPNLDITADVATVAPFLSNNVVESGPVYRKGYVSQVTAGPKTGFGLMASDYGIAFYNSQMMTSVTPVWDFQRQIAADPQGQRAAKMYSFDATTQDYAQLTIVAVFTTSGLQLHPQYQHNVDAAIGSTPQPTGGLRRAIASLIGFTQPRITQQVYEGAIPKMRQNVVQEAAELGQEKANEAAAQRNIAYSKYLIGNNRLRLNDFLIEGLSLRSRPEYALLGGTLHWFRGADQVGADMPQPRALAVPAPGVSADVHVSSILTSLAHGYLQSDEVKGIQNLMLLTKKVPPGGSPRDAFEVVKNADYPRFLGAITTAQEAGDPRVTALRVKRPGRPPNFSADARGYLVATVFDFQLEVPVPAQNARGGAMAGPPAKVYRITSPRAEFVVSFQVKPGPQAGPVHLTGRVEDLDLGPNAKVFAVNEDESKPVPLTVFNAALVKGFLLARVKGQPIDVPLTSLQLRGFAIHDVSALDPSGWMRVQLIRTSASPTAGVQ